MANTPDPHHRPSLILLACTLVLAGGLGYVWYLYLTTNQALTNLEAEHATLTREHASTTDALAVSTERAALLSEELDFTLAELDTTESALTREQRRNDDFEEQIETLAGTVGTLDKLSKTDRELLQKYSRTYFLNENFVPLKLSQIPEKYIMPDRKDQYFHGDAIRFLTDLLNAAKRAGHDIRVISAYRSFDEQQELKGQFTQVYGSGANTFSADQGYSEHQLGTAIDISDVETNGTFESFAETEAYAWLLQNAHRYGFVLSYPQDNTFYVFEPWHWRFVGRDLARDLDRADATFYDWDQRKIDEYLVKIFD